MSPDPTGSELLAQRVAAAPTRVASMLTQPFVPQQPASRRIRRVVATGIGSSEAQARYFVWLLNTFTDVPAHFVPLTTFMEPFGTASANCTLAVFSQGLSANASFALNQAGAFAHTLVFTAATEAGQRAAGRPERAELLAWLTSLEAEIIPFPTEDEYTILIRLIGPACGFVVAHQFVETVPESRLEPLANHAATIREWSASESAAPLREALKLHPDAWKSGSLLLLPAPLAEFAQNLGCKFFEGLFWPAPAMVELMQFAHGPFQQLARSPRPVCLIQGSRAADHELARRAATLLASIGIRPVSLSLDCKPAHAPIVLELLLNPVFRDLINHFGINQVDWPGKGLDGPMYNLSPRIPSPSLS